VPGKQERLPDPWDCVKGLSGDSWVVRLWGESSKPPSMPEIPSIGGIPPGDGGFLDSPRKPPRPKIDETRAR